jgi:hypothetical protein
MKERDYRIIVVLGMHRSGTSVIARGLQVLGVELGNRLMPASEGNNSKGFWEDVDINALNVEMLRSLKRDWHFLTPIQPADVESLCANGYLEHAVALLQEKTAGVRVFGFKDPRLGKLLPFWKKVFLQGPWMMSYILVIRHPLSVCQSVSKRDGFAFEKIYLLWAEHVLGSLVGTDGENRVLVDYDHFMQNPDKELARIAGELDLPLNAVELQHYQAEFLDRQLQHTIYRLEDLLLDDRSPLLVQEVYSSLLDPATGKAALETSPLQKKIREWNTEYLRMKASLIFADRLTSKLGAVNAERNALLHERVELKRAVAAKEQTLRKKETELLAIQQSRLWRWTQALRTFFDVLRPRK